MNDVLSYHIASYDTSKTEVVANVKLMEFSHALFIQFLDDPSVQSKVNAADATTKERRRADGFITWKRRRLLMTEFKVKYDDLEGAIKQMLNSLRPNALLRQPFLLGLACAGGMVALVVIKPKAQSPGSKNDYNHHNAFFTGQIIFEAKLHNDIAKFRFCQVLWTVSMIAKGWEEEQFGKEVDLPRVEANNTVLPPRTKEGEVVATINFTGDHAFKRCPVGAWEGERWGWAKEVYSLVAAGKVKGVVGAETQDSAAECPGWTEEKMLLGVSLKDNLRYFKGNKAEAEADLREALASLHANGFTHGDVRIDNVVVAVPGGVGKLGLGEDGKWEPNWRTRSRLRFKLIDMETVWKGDVTRGEGKEKADKDMASLEAVLGLLG